MKNVWNVYNIYICNMSQQCALASKKANSILDYSTRETWMYWKESSIGQSKGWRDWSTFCTRRCWESWDCDSVIQVVLHLKLPTFPFETVFYNTISATVFNNKVYEMLKTVFCLYFENVWKSTKFISWSHMYYLKNKFSIVLIRVENCCFHFY